MSTNTATKPSPLADLADRLRIAADEVGTTTGYCVDLDDYAGGSVSVEISFGNDSKLMELDTDLVVYEIFGQSEIDIDLDPSDFTEIVELISKIGDIAGELEDLQLEDSQGPSTQLIRGGDGAIFAEERDALGKVQRVVLVPAPEGNEYTAPELLPKPRPLTLTETYDLFTATRADQKLAAKCREVADLLK